ncbi:MAG: FtsX-like permease family protein [Pseudomonadota bacterium]|nr:FtsX-like permease family protein [Pseudomonadota bacterium]
MKALTLAWRLLRRDWRAGELRLLVLAIVVAVASVTTIAFFTDRVERAMARQATGVLAADLVVEWSRPANDAMRDTARENGLETAHTLDFPSVVVAGDRTQLVQVKGVSGTYPLRGVLLTATGPGGDDVVAKRIPAPHGAWVEARLLALLDLEVGDTLRLGERDFRISRVLTSEPDRAANLFRLAPRVLVSLGEVEQTGLLGPASRVRHRMLVAGAPGDVARFGDWLKDHLPDGATLQDVRTARPELRVALERGARFLRLAAVTATLLCVVAVAMSTRRFVERQSDAGALLRCLGASSRRVYAIFSLRLALLGLIGSLAGTLLGLALQTVLAQLVGNWFADDLPPPSAWPLVAGMATGVLLLAGFALPSVLRLANVPPLRVFQRAAGAPPLSFGVFVGAAGLSLAALLYWQIGDDALAFRLLGGLAGGLILLVLAARVLVRLLAPMRSRSTGSWRYGLASLSRNPATTTIQLTGFGLGITALLLLAMVRVDLLAAWQDALPENAPNHFLINIQPDEVDGVRKLLSDEGLTVGGPFPMVRGRLVSIAGRAVVPEDYENLRARRLAAREFNLSEAETPQPDNAIVAGQWWSGEDFEKPLFSVEEAIAGRLGIAVGDELGFDVAGQTVSGRVSNLRTVQWDSFNANFFVIGTPGLMRDLPATWIATFYLPAERYGVVKRLVQRYPSVTALDVTTLMKQVRDIMDRGALAVESVFVLTLVAGVVVLHAGIQASRELRAQEAAVLRTLGVRRRSLIGAITLEFALLGALAGLIAAVIASGTSYALAVFVFELPWQPNAGLWAIAVIGGALGVAIAGLAASWKLINIPPVAVLREI